MIWVASRPVTGTGLDFDAILRGVPTGGQQLAGITYDRPIRPNDHRRVGVVFEQPPAVDALAIVGENVLALSVLENVHAASLPGRGAVRWGSSWGNRVTKSPVRLQALRAKSWTCLAQ
jgi:hypothetical protein